jgi:glycosyltransferase involved in cell wall biosynthesis
MVHVQWLGQVPNLYWLKSFYRVPIIASARGSQVTVYPHTKPGYGDMIRQALCVVDACHLVSNDLRKAVLALGADEKKLFINYNGIDLNRFKPTNQRDSVDKTMRLISVGALIWRKGYVFQLTVLQQLLARNVPASLTIVGEGPDREGLIYMCKALGLKEYVILTGQLNESEIVERLTKSDAYLSTSLAEGLPNSVVEAAACGLPVVAFDCEGIREVVDHGVSGYVVGRGMIGEMAAFIEILQDGALRGRMGRYARQRMEDLFDQDKCVAEMIGHYQRMMHAG